MNTETGDRKQNAVVSTHGCAYDRLAASTDATNQQTRRQVAATRR
jgi:hypothetical protein